MSILSARAGAKHVYAIDNGEICLFTDQIVQDNMLAEKITVIKGNVQNIELPVEKVDIIVSQWINYFLIYDSYIEDVIYARDKFLDLDGFIFPDKAFIYMAAFSDENAYDHKFEFWDSIYGVNMSVIKHFSLKEAYIETCDDTYICSTISKIFEIDLYTARKEELNFSSRFELLSTKNVNITGLIIWFDVFFESQSRLYHNIRFSTSPFNEETQFKQILFYIDEKLTTQRGEKIEGSIAVRQSLINSSLDIKISGVSKNNYSHLYKLKY